MFDVSALTTDPEAAVRLVEELDEPTLHHLGAAVRDEVQRRAIADGNQDAVIRDAFETGFGRDGLALPPWITGPYVVCPGGMNAKSRSSHVCRFVSVNDCWIWECSELIHEEKRSTPGAQDGFRAVALLPIIEGLELDVVSGRQRGGQHRVDKVVSYEVRRGELVEVAQRNISAARMR